MSELNIILNNVSRFTTTELESLVAKSPYFQQAHLLLAKKYQLEGNPKFDQQLQLAALYTRDRELLFELFKEKELSPTSFVQSSTALPVEEPEEIILVPEEREEKEERKYEADLIPLTPEEIVVPKLDPEENVVLAIDVDRANEVPDILSDTPVLFDEPIYKENEDIIDELPIGVEEAFIPEETLLEAEEELQSEVAIIEEELIVEVTKEEPFAADEPHTFSEWLNAFSANTPPTPVEEPEVEEEVEIVEVEVKAETTPAKPVKDELDTIIQENISSDYLHNIVEEETRYTKGLNQFIEDQKKRKQPAGAKKPIDENDLAPEMITETMAKVYEMQKKYAKAIKAYEVLSLKMPEKSDLFAARINYLKNVI